MSYELVIKSCKSIETELVRIGANGKGLHEKLSSVENDLEEDLVTSIRQLATMRNKLIHEDGYEFTECDKAEFKKLANDTSKRLKAGVTLQSEKNMSNIQRKNYTVCSSCEKSIVPRIVFKNNVPAKSYCPHCCALVKDLNYSWFREFGEHLYLFFCMNPKMLKFVIALVIACVLVLVV